MNPSDSFEISGNLVDLDQRRIVPSAVRVVEGRIADIRPVSGSPGTFLTPGFVDAHVHVESSMLVPTEFARVATIHGTVATVSDPHEIGNVLGVEGVRFMLDNASRTALKFHFGAPACVPATPFETAGDEIGPREVARLLDDPRIGYLSEMMNYPGVLADEPDVIEKIQHARRRGKPVDGHAPRLRGAQARAYFGRGITTDHECTTKEEALERLELGVKILIREGSAARNFDALHSLIDLRPDLCMFCSDDIHPDQLLRGHIDSLVRRAVERGADLMNVMRCACVNPVEHYGLNVGLLRVGDPADFLELEDLRGFRVLRTFIDGRVVAQDGRPELPRVDSPEVNRFRATRRSPDEFRVEARGDRLRVIEAVDGELITGCLEETARIERGLAVADPDRDLLKIAVINRYRPAPPSIGFVKGFGLKRGAIASSVAHDSHNVLVVGADDGHLCAAVNRIVDAGGGLSAADDGIDELLPLPVAGLMTSRPYDEVARAYSRLERLARDRLGAALRSPYMTLSFMALPVIPELKITDKGLFDCRQSKMTSLFA